jgi:hypothetical protein
VSPVSQRRSGTKLFFAGIDFVCSRQPVDAQRRRATIIAVMTSSAGEMTIDDAWEYVKSAALAGWSRTTRRMRAAGVVLIFLYVLSMMHPAKPRNPLK